jgi:hypothetical protein
MGASGQKLIRRLAIFWNGRQGLRNESARSGVDPSRMTMPISIRRFAIIVAQLALFAVGCNTSYIPNTDVEDSDDNREVVSFCEKYRKAVEHKYIPGLLAMVSPRYYEDGGNVDASDDMDYEGLRQYMTEEFKKAKSIRYEIRYRRVHWSKESKRVFIDYTYSASYKVPGTEDKDEWRRTVAENRLELVREGESFKIVGGM